jgi:hypothetical protein
MSQPEVVRGTGLFAAALLPFVLLATLNSGGYRYGASDQAFYAPAILEGIDSSLFPRDSELIRSQARLTLVDDVIGPVGRVTGLELPNLFAALQVVTLALLLFAAIRIGASLYKTSWASVALAAALTLRHAITKSGTNTLEGYFHPRQLSFAIGALAVTQFLRGRYGVTFLLVAGAGALHPTTALWFAIWLGVATFVAERRLRVPLLAGAVLCALLVAGALSVGPLAGRLVRMDAEWLATLSTKDYLFPLKWPWITWFVNLGYIPIIAIIYRHRRASGALVDREHALVSGCLSLLGVFLTLLLFNSAGLALAIQLQPARIFWMLDFLAITYVVWAMAEGRRPNVTRARIVAMCMVILAIVRGSYVMFVEFPDRRIAQVDMNGGDWGQAMAWARTTDRTSGWLASPDHAARYGTSIRVAAQRDVFVEAIKDGAVGMYDRAVALRTRDRVEELGDFPNLTAEHARALARKYDLDYLVTEHAIDLPQVLSTGKLRIYRLKP